MEREEAAVEDELCSWIMSRLGKVEHQQVVGAMSQELREQRQPLSAVAYLGATCSSLERGSPHPSLLAILSVVLPRVSPAILRKKTDYLSDLIVSTHSSNIVGAIKCASHLLSASSSPSSSLYGFLVSYLTHHSPKVRKQSRTCLRRVLSTFQRTPSLLLPASEALAEIFERSLLLAGGGLGGAQEVLFLLDALADCLPLLSPDCSAVILNYFKSLLELRQPVVTRRIATSLNAVLRRHTPPPPPPDLLLDLLCSLAASVSSSDITSADDITFAARLLDLGIRNIYSLDRQLCVVKLPLVFNALGDMLASQHEEALFAATQAFKSLIQSCVDDILIKQGTDQISATRLVNVTKSAPTIIEKLCAAVENLLHYRYAAVWDMSFQIAAALFDILGVSSSYLMKGILTNLADMQNLPDEDFPYRKQLHECLGSAVAAMGPETFLSIIPLKLEKKDLSEANDWLFPILKQYIIGARLAFFTESILSMIGSVTRKSQMLEREGKIYSSRSVAGLVYSLWSLLPSFCNFPLDTSESFKELERELFRALREEPDLHGLICSSLQILIRQNKRAVEGKENLPDTEVSVSVKQAVARYTPQVASNNLSVLRSSAREFLSVLCGIFMQSSKDAGGSLQTTISQFASIANKEVVTRLFKTTMQKLLKVTQEAAKAGSAKRSNSMQIDNSSNERSVSLSRSQLFDLAVALLPGLEADEIDLLFAVIGRALEDVEGLVQKKAYKVLSVILKNSDGFLSRKLEELLKMMTSMLPSCHFSAKRHRLDCLYFIIVHISKDESEQRWQDYISSFLTEIILALKEANKKTRNRAYDIIVEIGHVCGDEEKGGKKENLNQYFNMVAGGLAGETPHMISAAVKGLARLAYEFSDLVSAAYNVLPSTFLLLQRKNREILKASLGFLKVLVAKSQSEGLQMHLRSIVEGLLMWQDGSKNHFKAKVKHILEMLVKKCGLDAVKSVMPEDHMKLLTNIRKSKERRERKTSAISEESRSHVSKATTSRLSRWNHTKIFSEYGDEETDSEAEYMDGKTVSGRRSKTVALMNSKASSLRSKRSREAAKSLPEDSYDQFEDEPLDLLDRQKTRSSLRSSENLGPRADFDDEPELDSEGRLIIRDGDGGGRKLKREIPHDDPDSERSQAGSHMSVNSKRGGKRKKTSESGWAYTGNEYASKKASGDVKIKGKLEPYAYWPLDRKMMSRRPEQRAAARKGMSSVIKMTKRLEGKSVANALSIKASKFKKAKKKTQKKNAH